MRVRGRVAVGAGRDDHPAQLQASLLSRRGPALFFALVAVVCLGVALRLPVLNAVNYLPFFNLVANGRMRLIYAFAVAVLAGLGLDEIVREPLFDLLNVKYVLTDRELDGKWELTYEDAGSVKIYRNTDVLPRAFVVYRAEIVDGASQSLERVTDSAFDFRTRVVLEEMPADWTEPLDVSAAAVQITDYQANRVRLEVDTAAAGLLVLTDTHGPGWKALLDGYSIPVYVADHAFRAVVVPAGRHQVEFVYEPLGFRIGTTVSLLTGVALILVASIARFRRARDPGQ